MSDHTLEDFKADLFERWQRPLRKKGSDASWEYGVDVELANLSDLSAGRLGSYLSKLGREMTSDVTKDGLAATSYSMLGLFREAKETYEAAAMAAWEETERTIAGKGHKFLTWSKGAQELRRRAGHREMTDEEMAEEDAGGEDVIAVHRDDWAALVVQIEDLYRVGETEGVAAAGAWLTARGIRWRRLTPAPTETRSEGTWTRSGRRRGERRSRSASGASGSA